jgi:hypothetical protein
MRTKRLRRYEAPLLVKRDILSAVAAIPYDSGDRNGSAVTVED